MKINRLLDALDEFRSSFDHKLVFLMGYKCWEIYCDRCGSMVRLCPIVQKILFDREKRYT